MKVYSVEVFISGTNDKPELRKERVIAGGWEEVLELLAHVCRDTGCVIKTMTVAETRDRPFDYQASPDRRTA